MTVIDRARFADIDVVCAIERASQPTTWTRDQWIAELTNDVARFEVFRGPDGQVQGFIDYWVVEDHVDLHSLAVAPAFRRRGVADRLMTHLIAVSRAHGAARIHLEVRAGNQAAQALYRKHGFVPVGVRKGYYADQGEDAVTMSLEL